MASLSKKTKRELAKAFKLSGLTISGEAIKGVWRQLAREENFEEALQVIIDGVKTHLKQNKEAIAVINADVIEKVVADLSKDDEDRVHESLQLVSSFEHANLSYKREKKEFFIVPATAAALNGTGDHKTEMYRSRLALIHQRVLRNESFRPPVAVSSGGQQGSYIKLCPIESLIGTTGTQCALGMLFRHHGKLYLEDYNSSIELRISEDTAIYDGIFTETCAVMVEGEYSDGVFVTNTVGMPPPEPRSETIPVLGNISMLGLDFNSEAYASIERVEVQEVAPPIVVLAEVHLDRPEVLDKLRKLFFGLASLLPSLIVFMGNFSAQPFGNTYDDRSRYQKGFDTLADILVGFPELTSTTRFIFIPGPNDPGGANVLPRVPIPRIFAKKLFQRVQQVHFTSNPARIRFYTQEFVFFRENLLSKLRRHQVLEPSAVTAAREAADSSFAPGTGDGMGEDGGGGAAAAGGGGGGAAAGARETTSNGSAKPAGDSLDIVAALAKTVLDQGHLCPMPLNARPVFWAYDHALRLCPQPTTVYLADQYDQYTKHYKGTTVANPGSFSTDFSFIVSWPSSGKLDFSRV